MPSRPQYRYPSRPSAANVRTALVLAALALAFFGAMIANHLP